MSTDSPNHPIENRLRQQDLWQKKAETQKGITESEGRLRALELHLSQVEEELQQFQGFSLTAFIYALIGRKGETVTRITREIQEYNEKCKETQEVMLSLRAEFEKIEAELATLTPAEGSTQVPIKPDLSVTPANESLEAAEFNQLGTDADTRLKFQAQLQKILECGEETVKDLHNEVETAASLGRCQVSSARGVFAAVMNHSRRHTLNECTERLRKSIRRFHGKLLGLLSDGESLISADLRDSITGIEILSNSITNAALTNSVSGTSEFDRIDEQLRLVNMLLEKQIIDTQNQVAALDAQRQQWLESA